MVVDEAIVLVGGQGTRLRSVVPDLPKPLAVVAGRPFLAWILDRLATEGIRRVVLATGYRAGQVRDAIGGDWQGMEIVHSVEATPLGTGGAVRLARAQLQGQHGVHVLNGDTFLEYALAGLESATRGAGARLGMALAHVQDIARYGCVELRDGRVVGFREKGGQGAGLVNAGCYFLDEAALAGLPEVEAFSFEDDVLRPMAGQGQVAGFTATRGFIDIGIPEDYLRAQDLFRHGGL